MARQRKTLRVEDLRTQINRRLKDPSLTPEARLALASMLETVLMDAGQYRGFNYLRWMNVGAAEWQQAGCPADKAPFIGDETLRHYF